MGRIVFQCYPPVSEVPMTSALARRPFPLIPLALLAACNTETSNERVLGIQAMSFANSEWSKDMAWIPRTRSLLVSVLQAASKARGISGKGRRASALVIGTSLTGG